jgi:hypothetical protein
MSAAAELNPPSDPDIPVGEALALGQAYVANLTAIARTARLLRRCYGPRVAALVADQLLGRSPPGTISITVDDLSWAERHDRRRPCKGDGQ